MREAIERLLGHLPAKELRVSVGKRSARVKVILESRALGRWFIEETSHIKRLVDSGRVVYVVPGNAKVVLTYPHSSRLLLPPPPRWGYPYHPANSPSVQETRGKYRILQERKPDIFHDNVGVKVKVGNTYRMTDLDLLMERNGRVEIAEVINGKSQNPVVSLQRKLRVWKTLRELGFPIHSVVIYVVPKSFSHFKEFYLPRILEFMSSSGFGGALYVADPLGNFLEKRKF